VRKLILVLAAIGLVFWSLLAWAASGLLGLAEGIAATGAPFIPLPPELVYWVAGLMSGAGGLLVWIVWFIGAAIIVIVTMVLLALVTPRYQRGGRGARYETFYEPRRTSGPTYDPVPPGEPEAMRPGARAAGESRSAEEIVSRVLGKGTRR